MFHLRRFQLKAEAGRARAAARATMMHDGESRLAAATGHPGPGSDGGPAPTASGARPTPKVKLRVKRHVMAGNSVKISGKVSPGGDRWVTSGVDGKKVRTVRDPPDGQLPACAGRRRAPASTRSRRSCRAPAAPSRRARAAEQVNAYRAAQASYYGPGLYGNGTACGRTLTPSTVGVANKSLPCGTKVTFRYRGTDRHGPRDRPRALSRATASGT